MQQTDMVHPQARIGIAVSGGMDSLVLAQVLSIRRAIMPFPVELMVLHLNPGFIKDSHLPLRPWCAQQGLASHIELTNFGTMAHSEKNKKSPCFLCSWNRRKRLFELCEQYKLTHLALGHHTEDLAETFFMNILHNGRVAGLAAKEDFFKGRLKIIRPLLLLEKKFIRTAAKQWNLPVWKNSCPSDGLTQRASVHKLIEELSTQGQDTKNKIFGALKRYQLDLDLKKP